jgi:hypothetical protein
MEKGENSLKSTDRRWNNGSIPAFEERVASSPDEIRIFTGRYLSKDSFSRKSGWQGKLNDDAAVLRRIRKSADPPHDSLERRLRR